MSQSTDMRGFLSFLVLRLIAKSPMSGEDLRDEIAQRKGSRPSPGTIYPVLKSLREAGLIKEDGKGAKIKKYSITPRGKRELEDATHRFVVIFYDMREEFYRFRL